MTLQSWDWGEGYPVFLSHLAEVKEHVAGLKASLKSYVQSQLSSRTTI